MTDRRRSARWGHPGLVFLVALFLLGPTPASADKDRVEAEGLVEKAKASFDNFMADPGMDGFREQLKQAKAVMIIPELLKAGIIIGASGGSGVMLSRHPKTDTWSYPYFYTMVSGTVGLQFGAQASEVILLVMTEQGLNNMLAFSFKLGANVSVAAGPVGAGIAAQSADILTYSRSKGFFGGFTVEGALLEARDKWNRAYYGEPLRPVDVLTKFDAQNPHADGLRVTLLDASRP